MYATVTYLTLAICLWMIFLFEWKARLILLICLTVVASIFFNDEANPRAALESLAAQNVRSIQRELAKQAQTHGDPSYPDSLSGITLVDFPFKYYRLKYEPHRKRSVGPITGFLLTATAVPSDCGPRYSFAVSEEGSIHFTKERREATLQEPVL